MVRLTLLSQADYEVWIARSIEEYAQEKAHAGNWTSEEAPRRARDEFQQLLPNGLATPNTYLLSIEDEASGRKVGLLWLAIRDPRAGRAFIFDFRIDEPYRRQGYGFGALRALDEFARELGMTEIGLHVFGHNHAARALYEKAGYEITNVNMVRKLG